MATKEPKRYSTKIIKGKAIKPQDRLKVIVTRKFDNVDGANTIFSSAVIHESSKPVLKWFRIPEGEEIELPPEIVDQVLGRKISKNVGNGFKMVNEFSVEVI